MSRLLLGLLLAAPTAMAADTAPLDDPMRPPGAPRLEASAGSSGQAAAVSTYRLSSTLVADGRRLALINDRLVSEGERIGTARVEAIRPGEVVLQYPWGRQTLRLLALKVKRSSDNE